MKNKKTRKDKLQLIGWREWISLPDLGIRWVKAKIDTGARSSSLHVFDIESQPDPDQKFIEFSVHPFQRKTASPIRTRAPLLEYRKIRSSNGHVMKRPVIITNISFLGETWPIELTLANRDQMGFRMLVGRQGIRNKMLVDTGKSFYGEKP